MRRAYISVASRVVDIDARCLDKTPTSHVFICIYICTCEVQLGSILLLSAQDCAPSACVSSTCQTLVNPTSWFKRVI